MSLITLVGGWNQAVAAVVKKAEETSVQQVRAENPIQTAEMVSATLSAPSHMAHPLRNAPCCLRIGSRAAPAPRAAPRRH